MSACRDCVRCEDCEGVAYCLADPVPFPPCPHDRALCGDHNIEGCPDCRRTAETEMYRSGDYDPNADPFFRPGADDDFNPARSWRYGLGPNRKEQGA